MPDGPRICSPSSILRGFASSACRRVSPSKIVGMRQARFPTGQHGLHAIGGRPRKVPVPAPQEPMPQRTGRGRPSGAQGAGSVPSLASICAVPRNGARCFARLDSGVEPEVLEVTGITQDGTPNKRHTVRVIARP
jgi:hypothetical protein